MYSFNKERLKNILYDLIKKTEIFEIILFTDEGMLITYAHKSQAGIKEPEKGYYDAIVSLFSALIPLNEQLIDNIHPSVPISRITINTREKETQENKGDDMEVSILPVNIGIYLLIFYPKSANVGIIEYELKKTRMDLFQYFQNPEKETSTEYALPREKGESKII